MINHETPQNTAKTLLEKSAPYVGADYVNDLGYQGESITVAIIDTGINFEHKDFDGKNIDGKNFVGSGLANDSNGHGTQVAGIIAADGELKGIAPKAKIIAYKVSDQGDSVASELIINAINQAIIDEIDIINISLGLNKTNPQINTAINNAVSQGVVVVVAAGNDGPRRETIGSPGISTSAITVGATYNNITSSIVATLDIDDKQYQVIPMVGTQKLDKPIDTEIVFGNYARERDLQDASFKDTIVLAERGSDIQEEIVYFSTKEQNAARVGAQAIIIYNNEKGVFLGELLHEFADDDYNPSIPALSISREDGLEIKDLLKNKTNARLDVFYNPDFVAHFSSRGPVSPFYNKPDLVAPGIFLNTTSINGEYNFTSGTSFATPHVAGAAALLLQKEPELAPVEIKSILMTTTRIITDSYNNKFPIAVSGSGRLDIKNAFSANLIITPPYLIFHISPNKTQDTQILDLKALENDIGDIKIKYDIPDDIKIKHDIQTNQIKITTELQKYSLGDIEGRLIIENKNTTYNIPILIKATSATMDITQDNDKLSITITHPQKWSYAKISITNAKTGDVNTISATPQRNATIKLNEIGQYWIEANIQTNGTTLNAYEKIYIESTDNNYNPFAFIEIPQRPIIIIAGILVMISIITGLKRN